MAKLTRIQAAKLRADYLEKREALLQAKVDQLGITLFERVYENYLIQLEQKAGRLVMNNKNISYVNGLDAIYRNFRDRYNVPVIKGFTEDLQGIIPLNEKYFNTITAKPTAAAALKASQVVNKGLGLTKTGKPIPNGFIDKFIRDQTLIKKIKLQTRQALVQGKGFQQFRQELKQTIQGVPDKPLSGGMQQYYRNNAYDTFTKVDRIASEEFAKDLGMEWFFYNGGIINDSRPFCIQCNGKLVHAPEFAKLTVKNLKEIYWPGIKSKDSSPQWDPLTELGRFACRHRKDYVDNRLAEKMKDKILKISSLTK